MTPVEIGEAYAVVRTATKYVKSLLELNKDVKVNQVAIELQQAILDLQFKLSEIQSKYEDLAEIKRQAEQKLVEYENWDAEAARYKLSEIAAGIFVYMLKPDDKAGEPMHWLCPNCFQKHEKSILSKPAVNGIKYKCHNCLFEIEPTRLPRLRTPDFRNPDFI
jgi:hypothetical protein